MIQINDLNYSYPGSRHEVFENVNLAINGGGIYGLLGKNGTGKSTLLYLIAGLLRPKSGVVNTFDMESSSREVFMLQQLFLVPEEYDMPEQTLSEVIKEMRMFYPNFSEEKMRSCLVDFEMPAEPNLKELSMGQKKKVYMSMALAAGTPLLLMDEPTNGLDIPSKALFRKVMSTHVEDGQTVIISTHQVHDVESLLDSVIILGDTGVMLNESVESITSRYKFETRQPQDMTPDIIYAEPSLNGNNVIVPRKECDPETVINLELFFTAVVNGLVSKAEQAKRTENEDVTQA